MKAKRKAAPPDPIRQAELILQLYELRREAVMREARSFVGGEFLPKSAKEFIETVTNGGRHGSFVLQVYGYWDMVAAFVHHGALDAMLVHDTCQEMYFQYAKIQPYLGEFRKEMKLPEWLISVERFFDGSKAARARLEVMKASLAAVATARAKQVKKAGA